MKKCIECYEEIDKKARLCKHCKSYQNWRRFIAFSNITIALIIAFLSVITLTSDTIYKIYKSIIADSEKAYFHLSLDRINPEGANITIKNLGENHIFAPEVFFCLVFLANEDYANHPIIDPDLIDTTKIRYPLKKELVQRFIIGYELQDMDSITLNPNEVKRLNYQTVLYYPDNILEEKDLFYFLKADDLVPTSCGLSIQDSLARDYFDFYPIKDLDIYLYQQSLEEFKEQEGT